MINEEIKYRLSFMDFKSLSDFVKVKYNFDMSNLALSITKRRIEDFLAQYNVTDYNSVISIIEKEKFWKFFQESIVVPTSEMFRDFEFWLKLKDKVIPKLKLKTDLKIWVPDITSDDELMSLLIVLHEAGLEDRFEIIATSPYDRENEFGTSMGLDNKKFELSKINYQTYNSNGEFEKYFVSKNKLFHLKKDLLINVKFKKFVFGKDYMLESYFDMILFRNRMIYYNNKGQRSALDSIYKSMKQKSFLFLGLKEQFGDWINKDRFSKFEKECNIFTKKK